MPTNLDHAFKQGQKTLEEEYFRQKFSRKIKSNIIQGKTK